MLRLVSTPQKLFRPADFSLPKLVKEPRSESFLFLRPGALGDLILTIPALQSIRQHAPSARVHLLGPPFAEGLLGRTGLVDQFHDADPPGFHTFFSTALPPDPRLAEFFAQFDHVLCYWADPDGTLESQLRKCCTGKLHAQPPLPADGSTRHVSEHLAEPLMREGFPFQVELPLLSAGADELEAGACELEELGHARGHAFAVVHPGSGSARKNWPVTHYAALVERMAGERPRAIVLLEGPADRGPAAALRSTLGTGRFPWLVRRPLPALAGVLARAAAYVGNDSGVSHLAAALGCPSVAIFGPTDPKHWRPLGPRVEVLGPGVEMASISVEDVLAALARIATDGPKAPTP